MDEYVGKAIVMTLSLTRDHEQRAHLPIEWVQLEVHRA
jgi:hypothetical protein